LYPHISPVFACPQFSLGRTSLDLKEVFSLFLSDMPSPLSENEFSAKRYIFMLPLTPISLAPNNLKNQIAKHEIITPSLSLFQKKTFLPSHEAKYLGLRGENSRDFSRFLGIPFLFRYPPFFGFAGFFR